MSPKTVTIVFLLLVGSCAGAEDRFYPVIGAGGAMTVIHSSTSDDKKPSAGVDRKSLAPEEKHDANEGGLPAVAADTPEPTSGRSKISTALYDSDSYTSSEDLDKAISTEKKRRFYLINNILTGTQVEADAEGVDKERGRLASSTIGSASDEGVLDLPKSTQVLTANEALKRIAGLRNCMAHPISGTDIAIDGVATTLVLNKQNYTFLDDSRVLEVYRLNGDGLRMLSARSYSTKDRRKAFASPLLALYDAQGCLVRVVTNYFDRFYMPTTKRHAGLGSNLIIHAEERFLAVVAPVAGLVLQSSAPYESSATGQLTFSLVER